MTNLVDVRTHPPYAAILKALDELPVDVAINLVAVWATEKDWNRLGGIQSSVRCELAELLDDEKYEPDYWVPEHGLWAHHRSCTEW